MTPLSEALDVTRFGGKATSLARLVAHGFSVPDGIALDVEQVRAIALGASDTDSNCAALVDTARGIAPLLAVRSSAVDEDSAVLSFAGMHTTRVGVLPRDVPTTLVEVFHSAHDAGVMAYRARHARTVSPEIAVVVQRAVHARVSGVLFTRHPTTGADELVIEATWGLGESVVQGSITPDHLRVAWDGRVLDERPGEKDVMWTLEERGAVERAVLHADVHRRCIDPLLLVELLALAERAKRVFGQALDLEWAHDGTQLFALQCRPITAR